MFSPRRLALASLTFALLATPPAFARDREDMANMPASNTQANANSSSTYELLNLFGDVFERVRSDYVEPVTDEKLIESALNGMLTSLDPHSSYMNPKNYGDMQVQTKGEFGGLGIEVTMENGLVKVISPIDDTPAAKAGVKPNDFISMIDDTPVMGMTLSDAVDKMRGKAGSKVRLTVLREGLKEPLKLTLERAVIKIKSVRGHSEGDVAYVRVTQFAESTSDTMKAEIARQMKEIGPKIKGIVLDLRNNPGGLLDQAIEVSDTFLDHGEIVSTRERDPKNTRRYSATPGDLTNGLPMVVLINEGSASASEIVAGALKDHKRAVIMGVKSFGKGSVQTVIPIPGHGAIRLTTARYYTPSGTSIQATGIEPDIKVEQSKIEVLKSDFLMSEAQLPGHLNNDQSSSSGTTVVVPAQTITLPGDKSKDKGDDNNTDADGNSTKDGNPSTDYQLSRAIDLLRAISIYQQTLSKPAAAPAPAAASTPATSAPAKADSKPDSKKE